MKNAPPGPAAAGEGAIERLLLRLHPRAAAQWSGASPREIVELERVAGRALPPSYRWFLERMGGSMGAMRYPTVDFSARGILAVYASGRIQPAPGLLLIGYESDELTPLHYFYDLDRPARGDALVVRMLTPQDERHEQFETLREMLAWGELWSQRIVPAAQQCRGTLRERGGDLHVKLAPVLAELGFEAPIETGACCGLYERADAALICSGTPDEPEGSQSFSLGGGDAATLGQVLGAIAREAAIELTLSAWTPPLPAAG